MNIKDDIRKHRLTYMVLPYDKKSQFIKQTISPWLLSKLPDVFEYINFATSSGGCIRYLLVDVFSDNFTWMLNSDHQIDALHMYYFSYWFVERHDVSKGPMTLGWDEMTNQLNYYEWPSWNNQQLIVKIK